MGGVGRGRGMEEEKGGERGGREDEEGAVGRQALTSTAGVGAALQQRRVAGKAAVPA